MKLLITDPAKQEFLEIIEYYKEEAQYLATLFIIEAFHSLNIVSQFPESGSIFYKNIRRFVVKGYPYYIIYSIRKNEIAVAAFAHQNRKPNYWKNNK